MTIPIKPLELMEGEFTDFMGIWKNHVPPSLCKKYIKYFDDLFTDDKSSFVDGTEQFNDNNLGRKDLSIMMNLHNVEYASEINQYLQACVLDYIREYGQLKNVPLISTDIKMQKTPPGGGYHIWHYESGSYEQSHRELVWAIYLNNIPDGEGETEFLYQKRRIKPEQGTVVIWPAAMTHTHKGNTVFTEDKYILTGWYIKIPKIR
jgi:hypothetical protein